MRKMFAEAMLLQCWSSRRRSEDLNSLVLNDSASRQSKTCMSYDASTNTNSVIRNSTIANVGLWSYCKLEPVGDTAKDVSWGPIESRPLVCPFIALVLKFHLCTML